MEVEENNEFLSKKLLEARAKIDPVFYEHAAIYVGLYQTIFGSFDDYGFTDRGAADVLIDEKIKTMAKVIDKILKANPKVDLDKIINAKKEDFGPGGTLVKPGLIKNSNPKKHYIDEEKAFDDILENGWIGNYFPLKSKTEYVSVRDRATGRVTKVERKILDNDVYNKKKDGTIDPTTNNTYVTTFLKNFDRSVAIAKDLTSKLGDRSKSGGMMTVDDARHMLKAEQNELSSLFEGYRASSEGSPFKFDKKSKGYKSGAYFEAFRGAGSDSAVNKLKEKNKFIRRSWGRIILKTLGLAAAGAATIFSGGMFLSASGVAVSALFGSTFAGLGVGSAITGGIGAVVGGTIFTRVGASWLKEAGFLYGKYKDRNHFMNGIGKYAPKDGKPQGYKKLKEQYYTALGLKDYFVKGDLKKIKKESRKYVKKYLKEYPNLKTNKKFYNYVDDQKGTFQTVYRKLSNVIQAVPENENRRKWTGDVLNDIRNVLNDKDKKLDFKELIPATQLLNDYSQQIGDVNTHYFQQAFAKSYENAFANAIYHQPYNKFTPSIGNRLEVKEIKDTLVYSEDAGAEKRIKANIEFMNSIRSPFLQSYAPVKLDANLGVSIEEQIDLKEKTIAGACERLCSSLTDDEKTKIQSIAQKLQNMTVQDDATAIATELATLTRGTADADFDKAKTYLNKMLAKRLNTSKYKANNIKTAIGAADTDPAMIKISTVPTLIENLERSKTGDFQTTGGKGIADIRDQIMSIQDSDSPNAKNIRQKALDMLDKQISTIENSEFLKTESTMLPVMQEGRYTALPDIMKFIKELKFEDLSSSKLNDWYTDKVSRTSFKPFIEVQLKSKLESLAKAEAENEKYKTGTAESFDAICKFIKSIKSCRYLDSAQTTRLILSMSENVEKAVKSKITTAKANFANSYNMAEFEIFLDLINENNPLREFLSLNTPETKKIEDEIRYMAGFNSLYQFVNTGITINGRRTKTNEEEAKGFSYAYMLTKDRRDSSDKLYQIISRMSTIAESGSTSNEKLTITAPTGSRNNLEFADKMRAVIKDLFDPAKGYSESEKYAALIVMKNINVSIFKTHFEHYVSNKVGNMSLDSYMSDIANKEDYQKSVLNSWIYDDNIPGTPVDEDKLGIIDLIERKLEEVVNDPNLADKCRRYGYKKVKGYLQSSGERSSAANFRQNDSLFM